MAAEISTLTWSKSAELQKLMYEDSKIMLIHTENNKKKIIS